MTAAADQDFFVGVRSNDLESLQVPKKPTKGKRSKRTRHAFFRPEVACTSLSESSEEEEELAYCLVMLAHGERYSEPPSASGSEAEEIQAPNSFELDKIRRPSKKPKKADAPSYNLKSGVVKNDVSRNQSFKCKTCNRIFYSYQALGGHRASHNKPKSCFATLQENESIDGELYSLHKSSPQVIHYADVDYSDNLNCDGALKDVERYECKTCNRKFHSYQALGGHRASHNKPNFCFATLQENESLEDNFHRSAPDAKELTSSETRERSDGVSSANKRAKIHECSDCHRVFPSGQALGGHKRCHSNPPATLATCTTTVSNMVQHFPQKMPEKTVLLDLNMPAAVDEDDCIQVEGSSLPYGLVGNAVDCHCCPNVKSKHKIKPCFIEQRGSCWYDTHNNDLHRQAEADAKLGNKIGLFRVQDLCFQKGLVLVG
eukprot:Gb_10423 [translate_table: standard]